MTHGNQRRCFGHAVTLQHRETEPAPEVFGGFAECGAAGKKGPELPAKLPMNLAKGPPTAQEAVIFHHRELFAQLFRSTLALVITLDRLAQCIEHARDCYDHRDAILPRRANDL